MRKQSEKTSVQDLDRASLHAVAQFCAWWLEAADTSYIAAHRAVANVGLCALCEGYVESNIPDANLHEVMRVLWRLMVMIYDDADYPFDGGFAYLEESSAGTMHLNPKRRAFAQAVIALDACTQA